MIKPYLVAPFPTQGVPFYRGKNVVVTGATGLIGSYIVKLLKESGAHVRACHGRNRKPNQFTLTADEIQPLDLHTLFEVRAAFQDADVVLNCAGITGGVNLPSIDPVSYVGPATAMVINALHICHELKVPLFGFLSSTTVYAPSAEAVREEDVERNEDLFPLYRGIGDSKRALEKMCLYYHETTGIGVSIIRPSGAYGRFDNFDEKTSHVIPGIVERAMRTKGESEFEVWGDGQDVRDFLHAQDVAMCMLLATEKLPRADPVNAASGIPITTEKLAITVLESVESSSSLKFDPSRPSALKTRMVNIDKAREMLGFSPTITLEDGIKDVVAWRKISQ